MCGGVQFEVTEALRDVWNCHCYRCRQFTGHYLPATSAHPDDVSYHCQETLAWYSPVPDVHYGFCQRCGSSLFWKADATPDQLAIAAGSLDQPTGLRTTTSWWTAEVADYHHQQPGLTEFPYES
jgi:hypothetical protein